MTREVIKMLLVVPTPLHHFALEVLWCQWDFGGQKVSSMIQKLISVMPNDQYDSHSAELLTKWNTYREKDKIKELTPITNRTIK
jgi:hypothetical protein